MKKQDNDILEMAAMSEKGSAEYRQSMGEARCILDKVFTLFGFDAAEGLREDGFVEWNRMRTKSVTLASVLSLLQPHENVFIMHRISQHELEAIGGGTVEDLRAI